MAGKTLEDDQVNTVSCGRGKLMLEAGKKTPLKSCDYRRKHGAENTPKNKDFGEIAIWFNHQ
jgi:hypothetical protein